MASSLITSWQIDGKTVETVTDIIFWGSKITGDGDCSHEIKRHLLLGRKVMTNLDSILKSRDITLPTNVHLVKAMVVSVVMYGCESWTVKKAEHQRINAFELWCQRRLLRIPWTARRSKQPILKDINPEYSLDGLMLKLKLPYFGHLIQRADLFEKILMLEKIEGRRRRGWQGMRWLDGITDSMDMSLSNFLGAGNGWGSLACCSPWGCKELDMTEWQNWSELNWLHGGFPSGSSHKETAGQCWRHKRYVLDPRVGKIPGEGSGKNFSILAWRIFWSEELGTLWSIGSQRTGHDWSNLAP